MRQTLIAILMWLSCATTAVATCDGASFFDRLTPAERALLDERVGATPFAEGLLWTAMRGATTLTLVGLWIVKTK